MPRPRSTVITEPGEHLATLHLAAQSEVVRARLAMLLLLKNDHSMTLEEVADRLSRSISTIKRWWKNYSDGGLEFLLQNGGGNDTVSLSGAASGLLLLHAKILNGEFATLEGVRQWISTTTGMPPEDMADRVTGTLPANAADLLLRFFQLLPRSTGLAEWVDGFRTVMRDLLPDVDHISVSINTECDLRTPEQYRPTLAVVQEASEGSAPLRIDEETDDPLSRVLASCRRQNFPFERYHPHHGFVYYHAGAYLGTIILWREEHRPRSFEHGLALMRTLQDLLAFLLADAIRRTRETTPVLEAFSIAMKRLITDLGLTRRQQSVLYLLAAGLTPDTIAETMHITLHTVRSHIRTIHQRAGVHTSAELLGRYLTPLTLTLSQGEEGIRNE